MPELTSNSPTLQILTETKIEWLVETTLLSLERTGVKVLNAEARDLLKAGGAELDGERVLFPARMVRDALASAPSEFTLYGRTGKHPIHLGRAGNYFGPGPTRNPHNPGHTPGGSSSGSAAAVAAGLCDIALGTQTIGSVNRPAAFCGVSGYKPSYDRISKRGVIPLAGSLDHVGIFSWNTTQIEIAASNVVRNWRSDGVSRKPRIGIPVGAYLDKAEPEGRSHLEAVATELAKAGFEVSEIAAFKDFEKVFNRHQLVLAAEAARVHEKWFARYAGLYHKKTIELIEAGLKIAPEALEKAVNEIPGFRNEIMLTMEQHGIDVWLTPSAPGPAPQGLESTGNPIMNLPWTQAGLPTLTIPSGRSDSGLPLGVQVVGKWDEDEQLFSFGKAIETIIGQDLSIQDFNSENKEYK